MKTYKEFKLYYSNGTKDKILEEFYEDYKQLSQLQQENIDLKQKMIRILENIDVSYNDWKKWKDELKESDK